MGRRAAETSGTNATAGSNLHHVIQVDPVWVEPSQHFVEMLLDRDWKNEEFSKLLVEYFHDSQKTINYAAAVKKYLNSHQSFIQDAEGSSSGVNREAPLNICHDQFLNDLDGVYMQQVLMQNNLQSFQDDLSQKLHHAKFWTMFYAVGVTAVVLITTAAATAIAKKQPIAAPAVASVLPVLLGPFWEWTFSLLKKCDDGVKKYMEITGSMASGAQISADVVSRLRSSASRFKSTAESADSGEERKKLVENFHELREIAAVFCQDTHSARNCTFDSIKNHIWIP